MKDFNRNEVESRIRENCRKLIDESNAVLRDVRHWNRTHPNEPAITVDDDLMQAIENKRYAEAVLRKLDGQSD